MKHYIKKINKQLEYEGEIFKWAVVYNHDYFGDINICICPDERMANSIADSLNFVISNHDQLNSKKE